MGYKQIKVPEELHWELKKIAAFKRTTLVKLLWKLVDKNAGVNEHTS